MTESKDVRIIRAKIATRKKMIEDNGMFGPIVAASTGILMVLISFIPVEGISTMWYFAVGGLIDCGIALWWCKYRKDQITILKYEIKELEAELDE